MPAEPSSTVIRWLLDGDPSIRWPMLHDLNARHRRGRAGESGDLDFHCWQ